MTNNTDTEPKFSRGERIAIDGASGVQYAVITKVEIHRSYYGHSQTFRRYNVRFDDGVTLNVGYDNRMSKVAA